MKTKTKRYDLIVVGALGTMIALALGGCSTMAQIHRQSNTRYSASMAAAKAAYVKTQNAKLAAKQENRHDTVVDEPYVDTTALTYHPSSRKLEEHASITLARMPASALPALLGRSTGIHVHFEENAMYQRSAPKSGGGTPAPVQMDSTLRAQPTPVSSTGATYTPIMAGPVSYSGTVKGELDAVTMSMGATWKYEQAENRVVVFRDETKAFHFDTLPIGDVSSSTPFGGGGQSVQGTSGQVIRVGGAGGTLDFKVSMDVWKDISGAIKSMLSPSGTMTLSQSSATIIVHDHWQNVNRIETYVHQLNHSMSEEISVNVKIYEVTANNSDNRGINWNLLYNSFQQSLDEPGLALGTVRPVIAGGSALVLSAPQANENGTASWFRGSQFFLDALSTLGKVSVVDDETQVTVNNTPVAFKVFDLTSYLAQTTPSLYTGNTSTPTTGGAAGLTPGNVETGLNVNLFPSVQADGKRILMQMALVDTVLNSIQSASSGGEQIQLPQISGRQSVERVWLRSGESYVIAGYMNTQTANNTSTPLTKSMWMFGGNRDITNSKDVLVVVVTPIAKAYDSTLR